LDAAVCWSGITAALKYIFPRFCYSFVIIRQILLSPQRDDGQVLSVHAGVNRSFFYWAFFIYYFMIISNFDGSAEEELFRFC